ncbi:MAG: hypothetical protein K8R48_01705 [Alphaproteobacteria bacterium]|nr:hypothetical protein [Alphaproteobacteria bacterium]
MKFSQSGLNNHPLVEQAFNVSYARATQGETFDATLQKVKQKMENWYNETWSFYQTTSYDDKTEMANRKKRLDGEYEGYLSRAGTVAQEVLEGDFSLLNLRPAQEIIDYAENTPPHVLAAALLLPGIKSDDDVEKMTADFGAETGELLHALYHIKDDPDLESYSAQDLEDFKDDPVEPQWELDRLTAASPDVKTIYLARMTVLMQHEIDTTKADLRQDSKADVALEAGREEKVYGLANAVARINPEMDRRFRDAFNELASLTSSTLRLAVDRGDDLVLKPAEKMILQQVKPKEKTDREPPPVDVI